jgi:hypothetical protein
MGAKRFFEAILYPWYEQHAIDGCWSKAGLDHFRNGQQGIRSERP